MIKHTLLAACLAGAACACTPAPQAPAAPKSTAPPSIQDAPPPTPLAPAAADHAAAMPQPETWVLPGSLGPLTTRLQLETRFGKANVREESFPGAEGLGSYPALVVFPDDPRKRLELVLDADNPDAPIRELRVSDARTVWRGKAGLRPGMRLAELVQLNAAPVSFYGLGWDYGGAVHDWHGGALANAVGAPVFRRVTLGSRPGLKTGDGLPQGDSVFRSDDARWPTLGRDIVVEELGISWPSDADG